MLKSRHVREIDCSIDNAVLGTLQGTNVSFRVNANGVFINDAQNIVTDIEAENGIVHVIDAVLVP